VNRLEIEPLTAERLSAAVELDRRCLGGLWTLDGYRRELESPNSDLLILQGMGNREQEIDEGALIPNFLLGLGCLWAIADEAHITLLLIHPDYRRQGLGQLLLTELLSSAWRRELRWATLEVRVSNQAAIALYQQFGFETAGRRKRYYQDNGEDALILWRGGLQHPDFSKTLQQWRRVAIDRLQQCNWQVGRDRHMTNS
jgi:ribosomal-protein-alanine N-acetyltransferase